MLSLSPVTFKPGDAASFVAVFHPDAKQQPSGDWLVSCPCPTHGKGRGDRNPSLSIAQGKDCIVFKCFADCEFNAICDAYRIRQEQTFKPKDKPQTNGNGIKRQEWIYQDEHGQRLYKKVRRDLPDGRKQYFQDRWDGRQWTNGLGNTRRVPYRLPELVANPLEPVYFVEGEKCADRLAREGRIATTSGGAETWEPEFARYLAGRVVVILPDNDGPGREYAAEVARDVAPVAGRLVTIELSGLPPKGDVYDWLEAGHTIDELETLVMDRLAEPSVEIPQIEPEPQPDVELSTGEPVPNGTPEPQPAPAHVSSTWADMGAILGDLEWHWPNYMPLGMITALVAAGDAGKSQIALHIAQRTLYGGFWPDGSPVEATGKVIWLDTEGSDLITYKRMLEWGIKPQDIIKPRVGDDLLNGVLLDTPQGLEALEREIILHLPRLVVIDTLRGAHTQKERDDDAMQSLLKTLATFAARYRCAMLINHHITKKHPAENLNVITLDRVRGSSVIANMARVILAIDQPDPENDRRRVQVIKCNLAPKAAPLGMDIDTQGLTFTEHAPGEPPRDTTFNRAIEFLKARLANGPDLTNVLEADAKEQGISVPTLNRARKLLRVVSLGKSAGGWLVSLPAEIND